MTNEQVFNGYIFEPQPDGTLQIRLSEEAGGSEVTNLPADLVTALRAYLGGTAEGQKAVGTPDVTVEPAREQPINPRDRVQENW